jgi:DNA-binding PadR family transcriptional regulator
MSEIMPCQEIRTRLVRSFLDVTVISMLSEEPLWGYRLMMLLNERYGVRVRPPTIYPLLDTMESEGFIVGEETVSGKRKRKQYRVTNRGLAQIACLKTVISEI